MSLSLSGSSALFSDCWSRFREAKTGVQVGCAAAGAVAIYSVWSIQVSNRNAPPRYNPGLPLIGGTIAFLKDPLALIAAGYKAKGGIFQMNIVTQRMCFLISPEACAPFYDNNDKVLDEAKLYKFTVPVFGPCVVFDVDWPVRKQQLGFVRDRFHFKHMDSYVSLVEDEAKAAFADMLSRGGKINIREEMVELLTRTSTACLMGAEVRQALTGGVAEALHALEQGMQSYSVFAPYIPTARHRKRDAARKQLSILFSKILAERRRTNTETDGTDMIAKLLNARYSPSGQALTDEEITGMCVAAFFGGMHNSAITTAWTLLYIHDNPEILARLKAEQADVMKGGDMTGQMDFKTLSSMVLLKACVKEALRLRPPLVILMRTAERPLEVCGYTVPKGTVVVSCPPATHRIEEVYNNAEAFIPDRWLDGNKALIKDAPHSYIAFGDGARRCLGEHFGYLQVMAIVAHCLQYYDLRLLDCLPGADFQGMVVGPGGECRGSLSARKEAVGSAGGA